MRSVHVPDLVRNGQMGPNPGNPHVPIQQLGRRLADGPLVTAVARRSDLPPVEKGLQAAVTVIRIASVEYHNTVVTRITVNWIEQANNSCDEAY